MATAKKTASKAPKAPAPVKGEKQEKTAPVATPPASAPERGIATRGKEFVGVVISDRAAKTVTVEWERRRLITKYERYERRYSRVYAHNTLGARMGDTVRVKETRPLSKTKHFIVTEIVTRAEGQA